MQYTAQEMNLKSLFTENKNVQGGTRDERRNEAFV